ncbi:OB-fold nucleic acid binding domain-containing protein [Dactylosporangium darangshiense]|uniref:OB-fold nucleic acid binding domain-containing protein n=2 Tax=Dactylosporangium darangshiense TaxID=579108 RepID=A0ABP8D381_9ACTN
MTAEREGGTVIMATDSEAVAGERGLRKFLRRLTASDSELDAEELQRDAKQCGSMPALTCQRGQVVSLKGRLRTVVYTPRTNLPTLEAELFDGSDLVTLVWLGRRHIAGIEPGRAITAKGRIAVRDGRKVLYNPYYELENPR